MTRTAVRRYLVVLLAVAVASLVAATTGARAVAGAAQGSTFTDSTGDATGTADITAVTVTNDTSSGAIAVGVNAVGFSTSTASTTLLVVYLDTDLNPATGNKGGAEYLLLGAKDDTGFGWDVLHWDGSSFQEVAQTSTMSFSRSGDLLTWTVGKADVGVTSGFALYVASVAIDSSGNPVGTDFAPDGGTWSYTMATPPAATPPPATSPPPAVAFKPVIAAPIATPALAGKQMTVRFAVSRSDTGAKLTTGTMVCDPTVSGKLIKHAEQFKNGIAQLKLVVPKTARGKLLKVRLTIRATGGKSSTRISAFHVR